MNNSDPLADAIPKMKRDAIVQSPLFEEIQTQLGRYLSGQISLDEFEEWFVPATWHLGKGEDPAADKLTGKILLHFAEFSNDHWTPDELDSLLRELLDPAIMDSPRLVRHS